MEKRKKLDKKVLGLCLLVALAAGGIGALFSANAKEIYQSLIKPPLAPPGWLFGVVWSVLYFAMAISAYLVITGRGTREEKQNTIRLYLIQLGVNLLWSPVFFTLTLFAAAFLVDVILILLVFLMILKTKRHTPVGAWLQVPYFLWVCFAGYLNLFIVLLN